MTTSSIRPVTRWWQAHPNPACQPWCKSDHKPDEFTQGAGFLCVRRVLDKNGQWVDLQQYQWGSEDSPGDIFTEPPTVYMDLGRLNGDPVDISAALASLAEITSAVEQARAIVEGRA